MHDLTLSDIHTALNRARTKLQRQEQALSASKAEVALWEQQLLNRQTGADVKPPKK